MSITDFLLARIAEDEHDANRELLLGTTTPLTRIHARVLAECAAKRAIVAEAEQEFRVIKETPMHNHPRLERAVIHRVTLQYLAAVYKDHPDYLPEWSA